VADTAEKRMKCVACNIEHGSVGGEINCLRSTVLLLRELNARTSGELAGARAVIETFLSHSKAYYAFPRTTGGMFDDLARADSKKKST
jgi:hypothetical protein